jgi:hypothetical protein
VPRKKKSKPPSKLKETTRAEDDRLRRGLQEADVETFKRAVKALFDESPKKKNS